MKMKKYSKTSKNYDPRFSEASTCSNFSSIDRSLADKEDDAECPDREGFGVKLNAPESIP